MGFRGAIKQGGGGLFNNQDYTFVEYEFSDVAPGEKKSGEWLYFVPTFLVDGGDKDAGQSQHMFIGAAERYEVSKDGQELTMADGSPVTWSAKVPFGRFTDTLTGDNGVDESELPDIEGGDPLTFEAILGRRLRLVQEVDVEGTAKRGPRKYKNAQGKTVEVPRTVTVVANVYPADGGGKAAGKTNAKAKGSAKDADDDDIDETVADYIVEALKASKSKSLKVDDLSMALTKVLIGKKNRDAIKARGLEESMHETEKGWTYNAKKETLTLDE